MYKKRRTGNRYRRSGSLHYKKSAHPYKLIAMILCISVGCGYAAAKYVVEPVVNYIPQTAETGMQKKSETIENSTEVPVKIVEDNVDVENTKEIAGYAVQFGCFSSRNAAETVMSSIDVQGLQVIENDEMYKIIGEIYSKKDNAKKALEEVPDDVDAFVTAVYK